MPTLEEMVRDIEGVLRSVDGPLEDSVRVEMAVRRIVTYFRSAELQVERIGDWLYEPQRTIAAAPRFPIDQGAALCEAHFLFICWDAIYKAAHNISRNAYGLTTPERVLTEYDSQLRSYRLARHHMEHFDERFPGQRRSDWRGDSNSISGTVAGIRRDGFFVFQRSEWDISRSGLAQLATIVNELIQGLWLEMNARRERFIREGESAMWAGRGTS